MQEGQIEYEKNLDFVEKSRSGILPDDLLTIVYISGTTGNPKGVMLTHGSFVQNVIANTPRLEIDPAKGETTVVMLPSWHVYERAFEYCAFFAGVTLVYSSPKNFAADLKEERPQILISVPRVWESIYQKLIKTLSKMPAFKRYLIFTFIKINQLYLSSKTYLKGGYVSLKKRSPVKKTGGYIMNVVVFFLTIPGHFLSTVLFKPFRVSVGGRLRGATSAAGALPKYLDELFNSIGITLINAYGMTKCAQGILSRTFGTNTFGTIGVPFDNVEVEIRRDDGTKTDIGEKGIETLSKPVAVLKALRIGAVAPYGFFTEETKMTVSFLEHFYMLVEHMKDPGMIRMLLHKGTKSEKVLDFAIANGIPELRRHKFTLQFLRSLHNALHGKKPGLLSNFIKKSAKPLLYEIEKIANSKSGTTEDFINQVKYSISNLFLSLKKALVVPPDFTRFHSKAGILTSYTYEYFRNRLTDILPALGTHTPMTESEISKMFPNVPHTLFREHKWQEDLKTLGIIPGSFIKKQTEGKLDFDWPAQVNTLLVEGNFNLILSIGQVVPHEVVGMAAVKVLIKVTLLVQFMVWKE